MSLCFYYVIPAMRPPLFCLLSSFGPHVHDKRTERKEKKAICIGSLFIESFHRCIHV